MLIHLDLLVFISHSCFLSNAPETRSKGEDKSILQWVEIYLIIDKLSLQWFKLIPQPEATTQYCSDMHMDYVLVPC